MPRSQKAADRPIAFCLHDKVHGTPPAIFQLSIRPEDLVCAEPSNMAVVQTLGGAWADIAGPGLATCTISGTTGWGAGDRPDGFEQFQKLYSIVFAQYHALRAQAVQEGKDPDGVKLIFSDGLDDFAWVVAPQVFNLRRNRSRPLLSQYNINMVKLDDKLPEEASFALNYESGTKAHAALSSLDGSIAKINAFADNIKGGVAAALGPIKAGVEGAMRLTGSALTSVRKLSAAGSNVSHSAMAPILEIAHGLTKVSLNITGIVAAGKSLPLSVKRDVMEVKSALNNASCLLSNSIKSASTLPDYTSLYGASNCSSTSGGMPASIWADKNVFPELFPASASPVTMSAPAEAAVSTLASVDILKPPSVATMAGLLDAVVAGTSISTEAVDKAVAAASGTQTKMTGASLGYV